MQDNTIQADPLQYTTMRGNLRHAKKMQGKTRQGKPSQGKII